MSMLHQPSASNSVSPALEARIRRGASIIEHMAAVLEAACTSSQVWGFDVDARPHLVAP